MRIQSAERKSLKLGTRSLGAPATSDRPGRLGRTQPDPATDAAPLGRAAAYALLAEQCRCRVDALAPRQRDVLAGLVAGYSNKQMGRMLGISPRTIEVYRAGMMDRLKARTLAQALHIAFVAGLVPSDTMSLGIR